MPITKTNKPKTAVKISAKAKKTTVSKPALITAKTFIKRLHELQSATELKKIQRYFKSGEGEYGAGDIFIGVKMGQIFSLAKEFANMHPDEIELLLENPIHEVRVGGVSIMDFQARNAKTTESRKKELFNLYIRRHDRINNWDLVDRAAIYVIGSYLLDKPKTVLYKLARSKNLWERRTAIVSTGYFIKHGNVNDTFKIAETLLHDKQDLIHKATGGWIREAGKKDPKKLETFLKKFAEVMPRTMLRYAIEHYDKKQRDTFLKMEQNATKTIIIEV